MRDENSPSNERLPQPTYVLAPDFYPGYAEEDQINLADYIRVLWRRRYLIVLGTLLCGVAAFVVSNLLPKEYEAHATLLIQPPVFATELRPATLTVESYQAIIESPYLISALRERLIEQGLIKEDEEMGSLESELYASKVQGNPYSPLIDLIVTADAPEKAKAIVDAWAVVAVMESSGLSTRGKQGALDFIQKEYPTAKERLSELEKELKATRDEYDRELMRRENQWDRKVTAFRTEWNLEILRQQLSSLEVKLTANIVKLGGIELQIKETGDTLDELKEEIQRHPQFVVISKAITDDALWERIGKDFSGGAAQELQNLRLRSESLNPVYQNLLQRVTDTQVSYDTLVPQKLHLEEQIAHEREEVQRLHTLILEKDLELQELLRDRKTDLALLDRERDYTENQLSREVNGSQKSYDTLADAYEKARLAEAEEPEDVKIGAYAALPTKPSGPKTLLNTAIALTVGLMMSVILAFLVEFVQTSGLSKDESRLKAGEQTFSLRKES